MPSPDLRAYHTLTLFDRDASELVERALVDAVAKLPGWVPREGNTELVLLEAIALLVAEAVFTVNRLPDAVVEVLMRLYGITRDLGGYATADVTFGLADALGHTIPGGTRVRLDLGDVTIDFLTDAGVVVAPGATTGTTAATATTRTSAANGTVAGTLLDLIDAIPYVDTVELDTMPTGGADAETDAEWRDRATTRFARLTEALVTPAHFVAASLEWPSVYRAMALDNHNGAGAANGHVAVAVAAAGGVPLAAPDKANLEAYLEALALANLDVHVIDPTVTAVAVTTDVKRLPGYTDAQVQANVAAAVNAYLDPDVWGWGATVRRNELIAVIDGAAGVDYVVTLTAPAADAALAGVAPLADAGVVTVTTS